MENKTDYTNLSIDEKLVLLDGKLNYLDKLIVHIEEKIDKLEKLESKLSETNIKPIEEVIENIPTTNTDSEPVAMGGSFGFGGNEPLDEEYTPVEKEPVVLDNIPLGGSFGFESEDTKVETVKEDIAEPITETPVETVVDETVVEATVEDTNESTPATNTNSEPVAMGGSFGFGGNEPLDEEYAPVEKEPVVLDNIPLGGSFGFESEDTKVETVKEDIEEPATTTPVETVVDDTPIEDTNESTPATNTNSEPVAMGGSFGFGGNEPIDEEYAPVEKEPVVLDNIPLGGSFGFESEDTKVETVKEDIEEPATTTPVEAVVNEPVVDDTPIEDTNESTPATNTNSEPVAMGGSFGFGGNESLDEEYAPVEKEPVVLDNIPLGGSFGFESEDTKVETVKEDIAEPITETPVETAIDETVVEATVEDTNESTPVTNTNSEPVAMGGSFGFGGNEPLDEEYTPVEKEPVVLDNIPLGGSFGFESEDTKVETVKEDIAEPITETPVETAIDETVVEATVEDTNESTPVTNTNSEPVAMGGSFGFGGNEPIDKEYAPVEKEPVVLDNIPLGGSFGFESEDTKVETVKEDIAEPITETPVETAIDETVVEATVEDTNESTPATNTNSEPVAMGGSFGFGGNEPIDEEYAPVEKEPVVLDNIPLGGSFGFESEDTKVETVNEDIEEPATTTPVEAVVDDNAVSDTTVKETTVEEDTIENIPTTTTDSEPVAMGGSFGFGGNEPIDEEYAPVEKEPVVLDNIPLGGSFGFESEDTKVETVKEDIAEPITETPVETAIDETVVKETIEDTNESTPVTNTNSEPVAMGGSFGFGGNEPIDEEYTPVEKEPVVLDNIPLGGSFGFESEDTKVETVKEDIEEPATTTPVETVVDDTPIEDTNESTPATNTNSEPVAMGGSFGFGGNEPIDEEYTPVEKEPVVLDNIPLGGSFGFESEDTKVETVKEDIAEPITETPVETAIDETVVEETIEDTNESTPVTNTNSEPVAMGGSFGFGGNEPIDEEYAPVEKEPVVLDNIPLGGSFGFESEDTKVETVKEDIAEPITETPVEAVVNEPVVDDTPIEDTNESTPATNTNSEPVAMGGSFGFGGNEPIDEEYAPVEKEPVVLDNIPLGGSFGFESEDTKVETVKEDIAEPVVENIVELRQKASKEKVAVDNSINFDNEDTKNIVELRQKASKATVVVEKPAVFTYDKEVSENIPDTNTDNESVAMGGSFGFGGNESLAEEYTTVEKKTILPEDIPLGGSFGFESENNN